MVECHFWATHAGAGLDLFWVQGRSRRGFEFKRSEAPTVTPSMKIALADLKLDRLEVVHAGDKSYPLGDRIQAVPLRQIRKALHPLPR
jgi:predicted AAA+ superfamily ATPase